jgi:hypothetical protein
MQTAAVPHAITPRPLTTRSKVTNKRRSFVDGDGNSAWARRWRDLIELHVADLGPPEALSEAQVSLVRRCATIEIELEAAEGRLSKGEEVDLDAYTRAAGHLRRILESLGLRRVARDLGPTHLVDHFSRPVVREAK